MGIIPIYLRIMPIPLVAIRDVSLSLEWGGILHDSCSIPFSALCGIMSTGQMKAKMKKKRNKKTFFFLERHGLVEGLLDQRLIVIGATSTAPATPALKVRIAAVLHKKNEQ